MIPIPFILFVIFMSLVFWIFTYQRRDQKRLPPGPRGTFIFNNFSLFSQPHLYQKIHRDMRKKYKDYMTLKIFRQPIVIVNDYRKLIDLYINKYPLETSGRPYLHILIEISEGSKNMFNSNIGPQWTFQRKLSHSALRKFSQNTKLDYYTRQSFDLFKELLIKHSLYSKEGIFPYEESYLLAYNITCAIILGKTFQFNDTRFTELRANIEFINDMFLRYFVLFSFPYLHKLPIPAIVKFKESFKYLLDYMTENIEEHKEAKCYQETPSDIVDFILKEREELQSNVSTNSKYLDDSYFRQVLLDLFFAGTDTTAITMTWLIGILATRRRFVLKIREEVQEFEAKEGRVVSVLDKQHFHYTQAVMYEILRYSAIVPLGVVHQTVADCKIDEYNLPKGTQIIANQYEFSFDPVYWKNPDEFSPERFMENGNLVNTKREGLMPFSCGRRVCVGETVAKGELFLLLCMICRELDFEWSLANDAIEVEERPDNTQFRYAAKYLVKVTEAP